MSRPRPRAASALAAALTALVAASGCVSERADPDGAPPATAASNPAHAGHDAGMAMAEPDGHSIYHSASRWLDRHGNERRLSALAGRIRVVAMVYTNCSFACPRLLLDMKRIEGELGPAYADRVGFVLVSIDPTRDSPARLAEFGTGARLDPERWTLLTAADGDEGHVLELAALLGVQYRRSPDGEFTHSNVLTVLDEEGVILHRQQGLGADPVATLEAIRSR